MSGASLILNGLKLCKYDLLLGASIYIMKKIPTIFKREFEGKNIVRVLPEITEGLENVLKFGIATVKYDGACCAVIDGRFYKRYDAKNGKPVPEGAIRCQNEADPVTGHLPCWVLVDRNNPADRWFSEAYDYSVGEINREFTNDSGLVDGTYEAVGRHFNGNPYGYENDILIPHGKNAVKVGRTYEEIRLYLERHNEEGLVFWLNGEPIAKIKRSDFGFKWNCK